jgi:galacturonosyltransferase
LKKILILANNDVGLYKFRKELISELLKNNEVVISIPNGEMVQPLVDMGCKFVDTPIDRRGVNPITDIKLYMKYRYILKLDGNCRT